jgi:hypothetical protein
VPEALPPLIVVGVVLVLVLMAIRRSSKRRGTKCLLAACASAVAGVALVAYGVLNETNWVACDSGGGKCAEHIEAQPILFGAGLGLLGLGLVLAIVAVPLLTKMLEDDRG